MQIPFEVVESTSNSVVVGMVVVVGMREGMQKVPAPC